jgi:hypothetical protein
MEKGGRLPSLMAILGLDASRFKGTLDSAKAEAAAAGQAISSSLGHHVIGAIGGVASIGMLEEVVRHTVEYGEQVSILSQRLGIGTDAVQAWDYALKLNGTSLEAHAKTFEKLAMSRKQAMEGNEKQIASFKALGVTIDDLKSKRLEDIALQIAEAFQSGDPQKLIADLREVGGRRAGEMVAAFRDGLADLVREAKDAGVVMSKEVVEGLREAADKSKVVWMEIVAGVAPAVNFLAKLIQGLWRGLQSAAETTVGFFVGLMPGSGGPGKVIDEMQKELQAKWKEQDDLAEERAKKRGQGLAGGAEEEENKKAERAADQSAKRKEELEERLARLQEKHYADSLSKEERITELHRKRAELGALLADNWSKMTEEQRLKAEIDVEELKGEEERAQRELDRPKKGRHGGDRSRNSLQAMGADYASMSPGQDAMLDSSRKSEGHLREIKEHLVKGHGRGEGRGVQF